MTTSGRAATSGMVPAFTLRSTPFCPVAQVAKVSLAARGTPWTQEAATEGSPARLTTSLGGIVSRGADEPAAMLDLIEALHPGAPLLPVDPIERRRLRDLADLAWNLQRLLSTVTRAVQSNEHDIAVHHLRQGLLRAEAALSPTNRAHALDFADAVLAPTLFRLQVLDVHHETFLLSGLPGLSAWGARLSRHPAVLTALGADAEATYLGILARRGAALTAVSDAAAWRLLLGHARSLHGAG
jgi:hypothetical protein